MSRITILARTVLLTLVAGVSVLAACAEPWRLAAAGLQGKGASRITTLLLTALGGDAAVSRLKSLTIDGSYLSTAGGGRHTATFRILVLFPDRFQISERMSAPDGQPAEKAMTLDGNVGWFGGRMRAAASGTSADEAMRVAARTEYLRTISLVLPVAPTGGLLTMSETASLLPGFPRGRTLDVGGPDGPVGQLVLDAQSHLPAELRFQRASLIGGTSESVWRASDHRPVSGLMLPFRMTKGSAGTVVQTWTVLRYAVNAPLDIAQFKQPNPAALRREPIR
jgi:hypothetical protein